MDYSPPRTVRPECPQRIAAYTVDARLRRPIPTDSVKVVGFPKLSAIVTLWMWIKNLFGYKAPDFHQGFQGFHVNDNDYVVISPKEWEIIRNDDKSIILRRTVRSGGRR